MPTQSKATKASKSPQSAPKGKASAPKTRGKAKGSKLPLTPAVAAPSEPKAIASSALKTPATEPGLAQGPAAKAPEAPRMPAPELQAQSEAPAKAPNWPTVAAFQRALAQAGHYGGLWDGQYGPWTRQAVLGFQRSQGLVATGEPTPATLSALGF